MDFKERLSGILQGWFIHEPALFQVLCTHEFVANPSISCCVRTGRKKVEYNPGFINNMSDEALEEALRVEAVRILLKHPYERKPEFCCDMAVALGSNVTIGDNYDPRYLKIERPVDFGLAGGMPYEWYSRRIQETLPENEGGSSDISELWEEDELTASMINEIINGIKSWGSLHGKIVELVRASTKVRINWRNILAGFRASVLSSERRLTRMRPNRRSGFEQMGSTREYTTKLLVAVDVSGSISSDSLSYFYGVINSAFKYGFEVIDVVQFDVGLGKVERLRHATKDICVYGRGGTSFQEPVDYAVENRYDGLIILTDGLATAPELPSYCRTKILWVCEDQHAYNSHHKWMEELGRVCVIDLK